MTNDTPNTTPDIGRNEPCPCGSGKKYKRCCGVSAAPKLGAPRAMPNFGGMGEGAPGGFSPDQMDPAQMAQVAQMLQRLPKGQMQRLQALMQQAMAGKDVSRDAEAFEKTLPVEFQNMLHGMKLPGMPEAPSVPAPQAEEVEMTPERARQLVEEAARSGKISKEQAAELLQKPEAAPDAAAPPEQSKDSGGISKIFRWGKK